MSSEMAAARHSIASETYPAVRGVHRWLNEEEIDALRHLLLQFVQHVAVTFVECRCTVQIFEKPDTLRTVVSSDMPFGTLGQASFPMGVGIAGWVAQTGAPLLVYDVTKEPRFVSLGREAAGTVMCVPMTDGTTMYGTITAWAPTTGTFDREALAILRAYALGAALAVAQAHRAMIQEATAHRATMLLALTRAVTACDDPRQALDIVMPFVSDVVPYSIGILVVEGEDCAPNTRIFTRALQPVEQREQLRQWALDAYDRQRGGMRGGQFTPMTDIIGGHMVFAVPLRAAGTMLGLACYFHTEPFDPNAQQTLQDCSYVIGTAVYNAELFRQTLVGKERFEAVFAYTIDGLLLLDETGTMALDANRAFYQLTGIAPDELALPVPVARIEEPWQECRHGIPVADTSVLRRWHLTPDGPRDRYLEVTESAIVIGETPHRLWLFHDATAMRHVEQTRTEFMSVVSHELRSPLTSIYGFLDILLQERAGALSAMQRDFLESASLSVRQLWRLVDDINDLVQSDLGRLKMQCEPVEIGAVIGTTVAQLAPLLANTGMRIETVIAPSLPVTMADPTRVQQVLNNLLTNAVKFSEPCTAVTVDARVVADAIHVTVRDTGPGVPPDDVERIFERFVKGTNTPQQDASGLGLGLAVVRQLVAAHGGRVWVTSTPGVGSDFTFSLPITPPDHATA